jgi:hypothetical protein
MPDQSQIRWFRDIRLDDVGLVGGKNGSNDLTQLTLGVDRDSEIVAFDFDERDPGMLEMLRLAVLGAKRNGRHVGICGEAPANYPEIARYLTGTRHRLDQRYPVERPAYDGGCRRRRVELGIRRDAWRGGRIGRLETSGAGGGERGEQDRS